LEKYGKNRVWPNQSKSLWPKKCIFVKKFGSMTHAQPPLNMPPNAYLLIQQWQKQLETEHQLRHHFYEIIDENTKMEFINGQIVFHSPVKKRHGDATGLIFTLINCYTNQFDLGWTGIEKMLVSLTRNDYEPDVCFWKKEKSDLFEDDQMHFPAPGLVVEVLSRKTAKTDRTTKYVDYEAHGVQEYWIVDPVKKKVEQFVLINGEYRLRFNDSTGLMKSEAVAGFEIEVEQIFDNTPILKTMQPLLK